MIETMMAAYVVALATLGGGLLVALVTRLADGGVRARGRTAAVRGAPARPRRLPGPTSPALCYGCCAGDAMRREHDAAAITC